MMWYVELEFPIFLVAILANLILGVLVYIYATQNASKKFFVFFVACQASWISINFAAFRIPGSVFLLFARLTLLTATWHAFSFLLFTYTFLNKDIKFPKKVLIPSLLALLIVSALTMSPFVFSRLGVDAQGNSAPESGPAIPVFAVFVGLCIAGAFATMIKKYRRSQGEEKSQWGYLIVGFSITFVLVLVLSFLNFIFYKNLGTVRFGHLYTLPFIIFTAYAMIKHRLLNIKALVVEIAGALLSVILLVQFFSSTSSTQYIVNGFVLISALFVTRLFVQGVKREVAQREQLEKLSRELTATNAKLNELSTFKTQLLSLASHQIKSPLAVIKGFTDILLEGLYGPMTDKVKSTILKIRHSADELISLINMLLDLRKVDEGKMDFQFSRTNLLFLVDTVVEQLKTLATTKSLEIKFSGDECMIKADEQKLRQVVQNLVDNAIKYTPSGSISVTVTDKNKTVIFAVEDSGLGISASLLPHLFEEFMRDARVKKEIRGTGLGLYIAKRIVEAHGGRIWAESAGEGKGSRFLVELPKYTEEDIIPVAPLPATLKT